MSKPHPFIDSVLGEFRPDEETIDNNHYVFVRRATIDVPEAYSQPYYDPETLVEKTISGKVTFEERKYVNKLNGDFSLNRKTLMTPTSKIKELIPKN